MPKDIERKIAVIFVTDVVGFSKSMEKNEDETLRSFRSCRDILDSLFQKYNGRIFNTAGDSVLAEFQSAVSAITCAKEFQELIRERNSSLNNDLEMCFRVGLNMGDVIVEGDNLYGDGVNIAARLEALSQSGGVCISKSLMDFISNKIDFDFHDLGEQKVKNTNIHAFDLLDPKLKKRVIETDSTMESDESKAPSIAVLPFNNLSNDPEQDYFADGITEDIISHLSQWKTFPVISNNSVFAYKNSKDTTKKIAADLAVRYLVVGSVRKGGNKVRINVKLINTEDDTQIWSQNWDRSLDDIFEIQDEVSQKVAVIISPALKLNELKRLDQKKNVNYSSWDEFLRGQSFYNKVNQTKGLAVKDQLELKRKAIAHCETSISLDENFSEPHIIIAFCIIDFVFEPTLAQDREQNEIKLQKHAEKAVNLDPNNPDAIVASAISLYVKQDTSRFVELIEKALSVNPNHPRSLQMYSMQLQREGEFDKAIAYVKQAIDIDPASRYDLESWLIFCYIAKQDWDNALVSINRSIEDTPHSRLFGFKAAVLALMGQLEESKVWLEKYLSDRPEIKSLDDYKKVVPEMNEYLKSNLIKGMQLAGLS